MSIFNVATVQSVRRDCPISPTLLSNDLRCIQIATINQRNATQGRNGEYAGYSNNPYAIIGKLLATDAVLHSEVPIASIVSACKDTLLAPKQTMGDKMHAAVLLVQFTGNSPSMLESCAVQLNEIVQNKAAALSGYDLLENLSQLALDFCIELLFLCLGKASGSDMLLLPPFKTKISWIGGM